MRPGRYCLCTIIIFVCLFIVLKQTARKPIMTGLKGREAAIYGILIEAWRGGRRRDAELTTKELEAKMAEAQRQGRAVGSGEVADAVKVLRRRFGCRWRRRRRRR